MTERIHKAKGLESEFLILRNQDVQRADLSYEAVGLLAYLMSLPADWKIYVSTLKRKGTGRDAVKRIVAELTEKGYLYVEQAHDEQGQFTTNDYHAYALPEYNPNFQPLTEKPLTDKPLTVNQPLQSKEKEQSKEKDIAPKGVDGKALPIPQELLALALGTTLVKGDFGNYGAVCKKLSASGISPDMYPDYVKFIRGISQKQGSWDVTVNSLVSNGRMSEYVTKQAAVIQTNPVPQQQSVTDSSLLKILENL